MERGMGGRIEEAFATAKERGEAAFVSFVTAGYPSAKGRLIYIYIYIYILHHRCGDVDTVFRMDTSISNSIMQILLPF
jgi:hypothetical protein